MPAAKTTFVRPNFRGNDVKHLKNANKKKLLKLNIIYIYIKVLGSRAPIKAFFVELLGEGGRLKVRVGGANVWRISYFTTIYSRRSVGAKSSHKSLHRSLVLREAVFSTAFWFFHEPLNSFYNQCIPRPWFLFVLIFSPFSNLFPIPRPFFSDHFNTLYANLLVYKCRKVV